MFKSLSSAVRRSTAHTESRRVRREPAPQPRIRWY